MGVPSTRRPIRAYAGRIHLVSQEVRWRCVVLPGFSHLRNRSGGISYLNWETQGRKRAIIQNWEEGKQEYLPAGSPQLSGWMKERSNVGKTSVILKKKLVETYRRDHANASSVSHRLTSHLSSGELLQCPRARTRFVIDGEPTTLRTIHPKEDTHPHTYTFQLHSEGPLKLLLST